VSDAATTLVYLEADDEVTTVVRRLRDAGDARVVLVAPGRSRATSSAVALRLLARVGEESGVRLSVVGDAVTRSLAGEAGLETYASVDDARRALVAPSPPTSRQAMIRVVRRRETTDLADETVAAPAVVTPAPSALDEATQAHPIPATTRAEPSVASRRLRRLPLAVVLAPLVITVAAGSALGAILLPAATIVITPRSQAIGPVEYELEIVDAERIAGTAEASATVTATGSYHVLEPAVGTVSLFNWTFGSVNVPAGTFVAAGEQAFATQADVTVPRGQLTTDGRIAAGDIAVAVVAAAPGPAANVAAEAINVVVDRNIDAQLRGFPENPEPRVLNPEPTSGGLDATGPEIIQPDVDAAVATLDAELAAAVVAALGSTEGQVAADAGGSAEPVIEGLDGLVGIRDQAEAAITATLDYERLSAPRDAVDERAVERFAGDPTVLPDGHQLLEHATAVTIGAARVEEGRLFVTVSVTGASAPAVERDFVLERIRGRSAVDAEAALEPIGTASVELWPGWVASVPELDWRVDVRIGQPSE
jgi:hypothetical protein